MRPGREIKETQLPHTVPSELHTGNSSTKRHASGFCDQCSMRISTSKKSRNMSGRRQGYRYCIQTLSTYGGRPWLMDISATAKGKGLFIQKCSSLFNDLIVLSYLAPSFFSFSFQMSLIRDWPKGTNSRDVNTERQLCHEGYPTSLAENLQ